MSVDTAGKSLVDLLNMLEQAPEPAPISMVPQTWGWLVLALALLMMCAVAVTVILRHRRANAYRRYALEQLEVPDISSAKVSEILRRTALAAYPREKVAGIHGDEWIRFLSQTSDNVQFNSETTRAITEAPYKETPQNPALTQLAQRWVKSHKPYRKT